MKNKLTILLGAAAAVALLSGCATSNVASNEGMPASALSFSPVTSTDDLVKWSGSFPNIRSIETYTFAAPATTEEPIEELPSFSENLQPGSLFTEPAGGEMKAYRIIRHTPNQR